MLKCFLLGFFSFPLLIFIGISILSRLLASEFDNWHDHSDMAEYCSYIEDNDNRE